MSTPTDQTLPDHRDAMIAGLLGLIMNWRLGKHFQNLEVTAGKAYPTTRRRNLQELSEIMKRWYRWHLPQMLAHLNSFELLWHLQRWQFQRRCGDHPSDVLGANVAGPRGAAVTKPSRNLLLSNDPLEANSTFQARCLSNFSSLESLQS